jgi:hypothetical protein
MSLLREKYPPVGDGTYLSESEETEAYEAYLIIQQFKGQGFLVSVEPDYEAIVKAMRASTYTFDDWSDEGVRSLSEIAVGAAYGEHT